MSKVGKKCGDPVPLLWAWPGPRMEISLAHTVERRTQDPGSRKLVAPKGWH